jgi:integrase/recombinase XerD
MPKTLEEYIREFGDHLRELEYSICTVNNYCMSVKQLLCDVVDDRSKDKEYNLKYTPETLTLKYIKDYSKRIKDTLEPNTQKMKLMSIKYYLRFIKAVYKSRVYDEYQDEKTLYGSRKDILKGRPIQDTNKEPLTEEEVRKFFKITEPHYRDHALLKMFFYSTQRIHSIVNLDIGDIDFDPKTNENGEVYYNVTFRYQKGMRKKPVTVPVCADAIESLKRYLDVREEPEQEGYTSDNYGRKLYYKDAVFLNGWGQRLKGISIYQMMKRYAVELGIKKPIHPHLWRHTAITLMDKAGMTDAEIKKLSGHSKLSNAINTYKNPLDTDIISKSQSALNLQPKPKEVTNPEPEDKDELIQQLVNEVKKLRKELDNQNRGYQ